LFSVKRVLRGAKGGAKFGLGVVGVGLAFGGIVDGGRMIELVANDPLGVIEELGIVAGYHAVGWGAIGAAIDSFKPTSKFTTRFINDEIKMFKGIGRDIYGGVRFIRGS